MSCWLPVLALSAGLGSLFSNAQVKNLQTPLDLHIAKVRAHEIDPLTARFSAACGLDVKKLTAHYGFANDQFWTWRVVGDLPKAYDLHVMHLIGTAEVWRLNQRMMVEEWNAMLDVASVSRSLYCFDLDKKLVMLDESEFRIPIDGTQRWGMHMRWSRGPKGEFVESEPFHYIGEDDQPAPIPKLTKDDRQIVVHWRRRLPAPETADGLKLPAALMGDAEKTSGPD